MKVKAANRTYWLLAPALMVVLAAYLLLRRISYTDGTVHLANINGEATIVFESEYGVPYINGSTDRAVAFALGYAHATDRLYDMQLRRMMAGGRLAEIFGKDALGMDLFIRSLQFSRTIRQEETALTQKTRELLEAYAEGVNSYVAESMMKPIEFYVLGITFERWTVKDSLTIMKFLAFFLSGNWQLTALRTGILSRHGKALAERLVPTGSLPEIFAHHSILKGEKDTGRKSHTPEPETKAKKATANSSDTRDAGVSKPHVIKRQDAARGSNSWAVHGSRTESGHPLLAVDPHTDHRIPGELYLARVKYPGNGPELMGATVAGLPLVVFGRNEHVAWGITTSLIENMDLYDVKLGKNATYFHGGEWKKLNFTTEIVKIKGEPDYEQKLYRTHHGPIMQVPMDQSVGMMTDITTAAFMNRTMAISWAGFQDSDRSIEATFKMNWAKTKDEFTDALKLFDGLAGAFTFATDAGDIGFWATGKIPVRRDVTDSLYVRDGSQIKEDWLGYYPAEDNPHVINPSTGYIVSCNNQINPGPAFHGVGSTVPTTARALRANLMLERQLAAGRKLSAGFMKNMQTDTVDAFAVKIAPLLAGIAKTHRGKFFNPGTEEYDTLGELAGHLENWNFEFNADSVQPVIFSLFYEELYSRMLHKHFSDSFERNSIIHNFFSDYFLADLILSWSRNESFETDLCENEFNANFTHINCLHNVIHSLLHVGSQLESEMGRDRVAWKWSYRHLLDYPHVPFSEVPVLKQFFHRNVPSPGNRNTLFMASNHYVKDDAVYASGPVFRMVADMSGMKSTYIMGDVGQSGSILSPNYDSMIKPMLQGDYLRYNESPKGRTLKLTN